MSEFVRESEASTLLRLAAEAGELPRDAAARRTHILRGLLKLVGGRDAACMEVRPAAGMVAVPGSLLTVDMPEDALRRVRPTLYEAQPVDPGMPAMLARPEPLLTLPRPRVVADPLWYRSDDFEQVRRPSGVDETLYSKLNLPDGTIFCTGIQRELNDRPFGDRECRIMDLFNRHCGTLYYVPPEPPAQADTRLSSLAPRLRSVVTELLGGSAEKQVALKLGLSRHTVHEYVKAIYRELGVNSRGELMAMFVANRAAAADAPQPAKPSAQASR